MKHRPRTKRTTTNNSNPDLKIKGSKLGTAVASSAPPTSSRLLVPVLTLVGVGVGVSLKHDNITFVLYSIQLTNKSRDYSYVVSEVIHICSSRLCS